MKSIKFDLSIDGVKVKDLDELRDHFTAEIIDLYRSGQLSKWLESRKIEGELSEINSLDRAGDDYFILNNLSRILQVNIGEEAIRLMVEAKNHKGVCQDGRKMQESQKLENGSKAIKQESNHMSRYNAVIVGQTGVGKSTLINYLYGSDVAKKGVGKPVTKNGFHPIDFELNGLPVTLFDSWGLEVGKFEQWLAELENEFKSRGVDQPASKWFHSVFYCIQAGSARVQECDIAIIKKFISEKYKISVILTKADQVSDEIEREMREEIQSQIKEISVIAVCSEEIKTRAGFTSRFGKDDVERQAFNDFLDSLIIRLPSRCKVVMEKRLSDWVKDQKNSIRDLGFMGIKRDDVQSEISSSAKNLVNKLDGLMNEEISSTLRMYHIFAEHLGYPPIPSKDVSHMFKEHKSSSKDMEWWEWAVAPFGIVLALPLAFLIKNSAKDDVKNFIDSCEDQVKKIIDHQVSNAKKELEDAKSKVRLSQ
jgi:predicted GTPase